MLHRDKNLLENRSLLFAIRMLQPHLPGDDEQGISGEVLTFGRGRGPRSGDLGQLGHGGGGNELVPRTVDALAGKCVVFLMQLKIIRWLENLR